MRHFTTWLDLHGVASCANRLPAWWINNRGNDLCRFDPSESNRQHFQPTLHSPQEVKIHEIMIHKPSLFLKHGNKLHSICMSHFMTWLDSHGVASPANQLSPWRINNRGNDSCQFDQIDFQPTMHSPPEVKIREIKVHEPSSFLKRGHKFQSICMICVQSIESSWIDNNLKPPYIVQGRKSTSGMSHQQQGKQRFVWIWLNQLE